VFLWNLHQNGQYIVKSLYMLLISNGVAHMNKQLWKLKVPLKFKKNYVVYEERGSPNKR
jgi:hypothetical protein